MPYKQSLAIERRLDAALRLIRTGRYSTSALAERLDVSVPTVSRCVQALRDRGHDIRAERHRSGWRYVLASKGQIRSPDSTRSVATPSFQPNYQR